MLFGKYEFICSFESEAQLPHYKGSTFRGIFGHALKKVICALKHQECTTCILMKQCLYPLIFETPTVRKPPEGARFALVPHPFVIEPPMNSHTHFSKGDSFDFTLLLFGAINSSLPYFIYAFDQMGKAGVGKNINGRRGGFILNEVRYAGNAIYRKAEGILDMPDSPEELAMEKLTYPPIDTLSLRLETPLRFKRDNRLSDALPFHVLIRNMIRRASALFSCYGDGNPDLDYPGLIKQAERIQTVSSNLRWFDWKRYSNRQEQDMNFGGLLGTITYAGDLSEFMPLIVFSEKVHIGKQTTFGLGKITIR